MITKICYNEDIYIGIFMAIPDKIRLIKRVNLFVDKLQTKYSQDKLILDELNKLSQALKKLEIYLNNLDQLKPNYNTSALSEYMDAINLHLVILKEKLAASDGKKLQQGISAIKAILKFHPIKHSYLEFIASWLFEFVYFI